MKRKKNVVIQTYNVEKENQSKPKSRRHRLISKVHKLLTINQSINNDCISCGEDIKHPICPNCIAEAFNEWLKKFPENHDIKHRLNIFMHRHSHIKGNSKKCVHCNKNVHVCPYCFTDYLRKLIKETDLGTQAITEFLFIFNFDFEHKGYSKELEAYGGY